MNGQGGGLTEREIIFKFLLPKGRPYWIGRINRAFTINAN